MGELGQLREDDEIFEFAGERGRTQSEGAEAIAIGSRDFLDHAVESQAFDESGELAAAFAREVAPKVFVGKASNGELSAKEGLEQGPIVGQEEVKPSVAALAGLNGLSDTVERSQIHGRVG